MGDPRDRPIKADRVVPKGICGKFGANFGTIGVRAPLPNQRVLKRGENPTRGTRMNTKIFIAALFAGTAIVPTAYAQNNSQANQPATTDRTQKSDQATDGTTASDADVVVNPSAPSIRVDVPEPDVTVDQAQPQVNVKQPQPTVIVHQPAPRVTVDIPKPQITVRMPAPNVDVNQAQPDVNVSQGQPQVSVARENQADINTDADATDRANVDIENAQAQVNIQRANQPQIRYEQEDAQVQVNQPEGQPEVKYVREGQADTMDDSQDDQATTSSTQNDGQSSMQTGDQQSSNDVSQARDAEFVAVVAGATRELQLTVDQIEEYNIIGENGNTLGDIQSVSRVNGKLYAVVGSGGFLGLGEKKVAIPLSSLQVENGAFVSPNISETQIESLQEFNADQYPSLDEDQTITVGGV
ncbi:PRC-barrel domain-containing protein [Aurantimonas sp. VKM B-3413]|uniref:PRC-barrel domain-containing protein n=1 Tax=Aurantimonas sp. VKM B-3413 TaxID=2779401 RepID=UPI001E40226F|nr:PRC-barrel domain-containing protein [Aurantimonas sp. VKM B-3413]MCB8838713.1 PRC-barrel domain-containing protein [Aurantimonas sp. VKM B-3413]